MPNNPFTEERESRRIQGGQVQGNPFRQERVRRDREQVTASAPSTSASSAYTQTTASKYVNNLLGFPQAAGDVLAMLAGGGEGLAALMSGESPRFRERIQEQQQQLPASALRSLPAPTVQDFAAGVRAAPSVLPGGESPGEAYERHRSEIQSEQEQMRRDHPIATGAGDLTGDALTIVTGRAPGARSRARARLSREAPTPREPGLRRAVDDVINSNVVRTLRGGGVRVRETGLEGAVLAALNDGDPFQTAVTAGAMQAGGSASAKLLSEATGVLPGKPLASLAISAGVAGSLYQMFKEIVPGGNDYILESTESGHKKIMGSVALGALANFTGLGRRSGERFEENLPIIAESITAFPRGALLSFFSEMTEAEEGDDETLPLVTSKLSEDPAYFGQEAGLRLQNALRSENRSFKGEVDRLMRESQFSERVEALRSEESPTSSRPQ